VPNDTKTDADERVSEMLPAARALFATAQTASLASQLAEPETHGLPQAQPHVTLTLLGRTETNSLFLLLSDLSLQARSLRHDGRMSLLLDGTAGFADPLAGPRLTLFGEARLIEQGATTEELKCLFRSQHKGGAIWAHFGDFRAYRLSFSAAHFIAGYGRVAWLPIERLIEQ